MKLSGRIATSLIIVSLGGCGGGGGSGDDPLLPDAPPAVDAAPAGIPFDEVFDRYVTAVCESIVACGQLANQQICELYFGGEINVGLAQFGAGVADGTLIYDGVAAATCLASFDGQSCDATSEERREEPPACANVFVGTVADGGTCFIDDQCVSGTCDVPECGEACCEGTCGPSNPLAELGESCVDTACVAGAFCDETATCAALLAAAAPCTYAEQCDYGLSCLGGSCGVAPTTGQACPDGECALIGDRCTDGICATLGGVGDSCATVNCQNGLYCNQSGAPVCAEFPTVGQSCAALGFCQEGYCDGVSGLCKVRQATGAACDGQLACASGYCDETVDPAVCAEPPACSAS